MGVLCLVLVLLFSVLCRRFAVILVGKRELIALLKWSSRWLVTVSFLGRLFLTVPLVGLQCVIVVFVDHTHLLFSSVLGNIKDLLTF